MSKPIRSAGYRSATHTGYSAQAQHNSVAQLVSLEIMDGTCESLYLVAFILAGPVYNNALKNRAALLCRALRRVNRLCSRTVSDPANRLRKTRKKKSSAVPLISKRSHIGNLRQIRKQGKGRSSKRKGNRRCPFLFAHRRGYGVVPAAGRGTFPPSADGESPAEVQRKTSRPLGANTLTQFECPAQSVQKRSRPLGANTLTQFACPGQPVQKRSRPVRANTLTQFARPGFPVQEGAAPSGRTR